MDIMQMTRDLGAALQQQEVFLAYQMAKQQNDEDQMLQDQIGKLNLLRMQYNTAASAQERDENKLNAMSEEYKAVYEAVVNNENMRRYNAAKQEIDGLLNQMVSIMQLCAQGEDPATCQPAASCGGDCGGCSGC